MAATLLTIFGPTLWVLRAEIGTLWRNAARAGEVRVWGAAFAITLVLNCLIGPTPARYGLAQGGFTQVCLLGFVPLVLRLLDHAPSVRLRRIVRWHLLTGFGPFVVLALGVLLATHLPYAGPRRAGGKAHLGRSRSLDAAPARARVAGGKFFPGGLVVFAARGRRILVGRRPRERPECARAAHRRSD